MSIPLISILCSYFDSARQMWFNYAKPCYCHNGHSGTVFDLQDGIGDTIRVSLTEPPEEEIDPCRRLANLGMRAAELQQGVVGFYNILCVSN